MRSQAVPKFLLLPIHFLLLLRYHLPQSEIFVQRKIFSFSGCLLLLGVSFSAVHQCRTWKQAELCWKTFFHMQLFPRCLGRDCKHVFFRWVHRGWYLVVFHGEKCLRNWPHPAWCQAWRYNIFIAGFFKKRKTLSHTAWSPQCEFCWWHAEGLWKVNHASDNCKPSAKVIFGEHLIVTLKYMSQCKKLHVYCWTWMWYT